MAEQANSAAGPETGFREQLSMMWRAFAGSPVRSMILWLCAGLAAIILATAFGQVLLNRWNQPFYDAIENRNLAGFLQQLLVFAEIAGALLVLNVAQAWLNQMLHLKLREGLTRDLIGEWLQGRRAFRLVGAGAIGINPDQRMHEDARHLADLTADLGIGLFQATVLLVSFVGVLWAVSSGFVFQMGGRSFDIPGYMVWAALVYAGLASGLSWLVGRPLIRLNSERYAREAELRFSLVRVNENVEAISIAGGEADERRRLEYDLADVLQATRRIIGAAVRLTWVTAGYGWITVVAPIVIASPIYFQGSISFGGLMMAAAAFTQVHAALRWFVDNIGGIADWRATLLRVASFRSVLVRTDTLHETEKRIALTQSDRIVIDDLEIVSPEGCSRLSDLHLEVAAGERLAITGAPGAGKTLFFRALAGLWPWGSGSIGLPHGIVFVPSTPYLPPGTLREVLAYPSERTKFDDSGMKAALELMALGRLAESLDREARWDRELSDDDRRMLGFARLALHKPAWIVIDEALDGLPEEMRQRVVSAFDSALTGSAIVNIGMKGADGAHFLRELHLTLDRRARALPALPKA